MSLSVFIQGRTAKALKSLQFANPGRHTEFAPEANKREKRRLQSKSTSIHSDRWAGFSALIRFILAFIPSGKIVVLFASQPYFKSD